MEPSRRLTSVFLALAFGLAGTASGAVTLTVTSTADDGAGTLRQALADAAGGDVIDFLLPEPATITLTTGQLVVEDDVEIRGPGAAQLTVSGAGASRVFQIEPGVTATISGLMISGGAVTDFGGGVLLRGTLTLEGVVVSDNSAGEDGLGGGVFSELESLTLIGSTVSGNEADRGGGIAHFGDGPLTVLDSSVTANIADIGGGLVLAGDGSLVLAGDGSLDVQDSTVSQNVAQFGGGVVVIGGESVTVAGGIVTDNQAEVAGGLLLDSAGAVVLEATTVAGNTATSADGALAGGIFHAGDGSLTLLESTVSGNLAESTSSGAFGGGMVIGGAGSSTIRNSTVSGNEALVGAGGGVFGGGIHHLSDGGLTILNSTVSGNAALAGAGGLASGGGIFHSSADGPLSLLNATVAENVAQGDLILGGGLFNSDTTASQDSILAGNTGGNCSNLDTLTVSGTNFADDGTCSGFTQVTAADLDLGPLQDNGGATLTHALSADSVAVDTAGVCQDAGGDPLTEDQRAAPRPVDGDGDTTASCDVGAFERIPAGTLTLAVDPASEPEGDDGGAHVVTFTVRRFDGAEGEVTVDAMLEPGSTATPGTDFTDPGALAPLTFAEGVTEQVVEVTVLGDDLVEPDETIVLALENPGGGAVLLEPSTVPHTVLDDDLGVFAAAFGAEKTAVGDGTLLPGAIVDYTILLTNLGPGDRADLAGDELVDVLPPELDLLSAVADTGTATADPGTNTVTWNGALDAGESAVIAVQAQIREGVPLGTAVPNQATLSFDFDNDGDHDAQALSDDPGTPQVEDPTVLLVAADSVLEIPTLGTWALWLLALALAGFGALRIRT